MSVLHYFKDYDLIELLEDYVLKAYLRKKKKELDDAREFHEKNFQDCIDENKKNHYLISDVITDIKQNYSFEYSSICVYWAPIFPRNPLYNFYSVYSWAPIAVSDRIKIYNDSVEPYKENTKLQRCGYQY